MNNLLSHSPIARQSDPITSHLSARELSKTGARARQQHAVLVGLKHYTNCTSAELAKHIGMERHVTGRRLPELEHAHLVSRGLQRKCEVTGRLSLTWSANV